MGGQLQPVLMQFTPQLSVKTLGGGGGSGGGWLGWVNTSPGHPQSVRPSLRDAPGLGGPGCHGHKDC